MADNYKILAQDTAESIEENSNQNQANIIYTVPENTQAAISSISLINSSNTNEDYYLGVVKSSDAISGDIVQLPTFVALPYTGNLAMHSIGGTSWTNTTIHSSGWSGVAYGNGKFVAVNVASNSGAYSTDGITWSISTLPNSGYNAIAYGNNKFVAVGSSGLFAYSEDGVNWTQGALPSLLGASLIAYGNNKFVALGYSSANYAYSEDGVNWTQGALPAFSGDRTGIAYGDNKFVVSRTFSSSVLYSLDGLAWTFASIEYGNWGAIAYGGGRFVAITNTGLIAHSIDAVTWTQSNLPTINGDWASIIYGNDKFIALTQNRTIAAHSVDGNVWTQFSIPSGNWRATSYGDVGFDIKAISNAQIIIPNRSIAPNVVDEIVGGITLSEGDQIRVYSESPDLIVQVYGVEIA